MFATVLVLALGVSATRTDPKTVPAAEAETHLVKRIHPVIPPLAKQARIGGKVKLLVVIGPSGQVTSAKVVAGHPLLAASAAEAVTQWRYRPFLESGQGVAVTTEVEVEFPGEPDAIRTSQQRALVRPAWFDNPDAFCAELAARANGRSAKFKITRRDPPRFEDFPAEPIGRPRTKEGLLHKDDWRDVRKAAREIRKEARKGPDFAGRYAIIRTSCGTWCTNAVIADVITGSRSGVPFLGVVGCRFVTGGHDTIERRPDSRLMIVRGSLEMTYGHTFDDGPCGTFSFLWDRGRLRLLTCQIAKAAGK